MSDLDLGDVHRRRDRVLDGGRNQTQEHTFDAWKHTEVFCAANDLATFFCSPCLLEEKQVEMRIAPAFLQLHRVSIPTPTSAHTSAISDAMSEIFLVRGYAEGCPQVGPRTYSEMERTKALFLSTYRLYNLKYNLDYIIWIIYSGLNKLNVIVC
jgi:hypothetical protein